MRTRAQLIAVGWALVLISLIAAPRVLAQPLHDQNSKSVWRTGMVRLSKSAWAGDVRLKSGMYHVKHVVDGNTHMIAFKSVMLPGGKGFPMWEENELVRLECRIEPATKQVRNTRVRLGKNPTGEPVIQEIQIAGEKTRHIFLSDTRASR